MAMKCPAGLPESNHSKADASIITNTTVNSPVDELKEKMDESAKATRPGAARYIFAG
jgi:activator of HSP90 ATPase